MLSRHRTRCTSISIALVAGLLSPLAGTAQANHVGGVSVTPSTAALAPNTCEPVVVQTQGGTDPVHAVVDVEARSTEILLNETAADIEFCDPTAPGIVNPVTIGAARVTSVPAHRDRWNHRK